MIGARAFAAVGALTAAHWKPSDGDYRNALASIVKTGSGPISWQHPSSSDIISAVDFDEASLAAAWDSAFPASTSTGNPIARLTVDGQSLAKAGADLQDGLVDTYQKLLSPWMGRLDDTRPGQIAALSLCDVRLKVATTILKLGPNPDNGTQVYCVGTFVCPLPFFLLSPLPPLSNPIFDLPNSSGWPTANRAPVAD